ncbi:RagB/SusD family nutrient uptake outer membrane protein [Niabella drilacis]|uniref:Starch-binding associating with outer membrane n=1 Tax=Niabella drilacis (strain DSM 25811 / CCM 8410 / CCUG 62505 / LMG 26954 / E90) TaxID=1285928 RepID=A0A1G6ZXI6_NIADE|nr:RagB/SusD family nutrient uptake outer membrane protein [Niabella drilacis]SDE06346.1 Starch-binding associating with outer membrane [Niabella drilacis]
MKSKIIIAISILWTGTFLSSCSKVLDKAPLDSYTDESVWKDLKLAEAYANNIYNVLPTFTVDWGSSLNRSVVLSSACDEGFTKFGDGYTCGARNVLNKGLLSPDNAGSFDIWSKNYGQIQNANIFLSKIDDVPGEEAYRNRIKGEVTFLRAYAYFQLISDYGGVPLITQPFNLNSDFKATRSSFDECVKFVSDELDKAAALLASTTAQRGRASTPLALAIKSRLLLYAASPLWNPTGDPAKWTAASAAAKAVIDLPGFSLFTGNYADLFTTSNSELIGVHLSGYKGEWDPFNGLEMMCFPNGYHGWAAFAPTQDLVDAFGTADGKYITDPASGYDPQKPYVNRDRRFYADIIFDGRLTGNPAFFSDRTTTAAQFYEGGYDSDQGFDAWNNSLTRYAFRKYMDTTFNFNATTQTNKFWILARLGEIYLNYAEAEFHLGHEDVARDYLQRIRVRAGITAPLTETGAALEARIRNERQVELAFEGHRYYDVRRWKIAETTENKPVRQVIITRNATTGAKTYQYKDIEPRSFDKTRHYLMPIPRTEIKRTGLQQNPGYN